MVKERTRNKKLTHTYIVRQAKFDKMTNIILFLREKKTNNQINKIDNIMIEPGENTKKNQEA